MQVFLRYGLGFWLLALGLALPAVAQNQFSTQHKEKPHDRQHPRLSPKPERETYQRQSGIHNQHNELIDRGGAEHRSSKQAKAYDQSRRQSYSIKPEVRSGKAAKVEREHQSDLHSSFQQQEAESNIDKRARAYDKSRTQTYSQKSHNDPTGATRKHHAKEVSGQTADFATGAATPDAQKGTAYDKSRKITHNPKLNIVAQPGVAKARAYDKSRRISLGLKLDAVAPASRGRERARAKSEKIAASEKGNTMLLSDHEALMKKKDEKMSESVKGNTMDRMAYRKMLKDKGRKFAAAEKGNTMERTDYEKMVKRRSERIASATKGNTLGREAHERLMKNKSEDIADYDAGYLNTKAERRARLRSLIHPKEYQANSPQEQHAKAKRKSDEIAGFAGKRKRSSRRKIENAAPSSRAYNNRIALTSMNARGAAQKRGARQVARNKKSFLPVFMRKKTPKSKYDDVEKGIWNE